MRNRIEAAVLTFVAAIGLPILSFADTVIMPSASLSGDDPDGTFNAFGDGYGASVDTWRKWLFVGAPRETTFRDGSDKSDGAVYIYRRIAGAYVFQQKLTMPGTSAVSGDRLGAGVAAAGGWLFVAVANDQDFPGLTDPLEDSSGAPFLFAGKVHVYKFNGSAWDFTQTLTAPIPKSGGGFGGRTQASHIALNRKGSVVVISEINGLSEDGGQLHTYRLRRDGWQYVQSIDAPVMGSFGDDLVFASDRYLLVGGSDTFAATETSRGYVFVYKAKGKSGKFPVSPTQTIAGPVYAFDECTTRSGFGQSGFDAAGGVVAIADACASGAAGPATGSVDIYRVRSGRSPLRLTATIEGDAANLFLGGNTFGSRNSVAVSQSGKRILVGSPMAFSGALDDGADVRVYSFVRGNWIRESNLSSFTPATGDFRSFGDTVFFLGKRAAFVREGNFLSPVENGWKSQGLLYKLKR